jgi:DNA-binding PadR family transcriptional regulator
MHKDRLGTRRVFGHRARRGDMTPIILKLLSKEPMHGYQIISRLEEKTHGLWKPSPGSVYPTLQMLEEQDLISSKSEGGKKVYSLTESGKKEAEKVKQEHKAHWENEDSFKQHQELRELFFENISLLRSIAATESDEKLEKIKVILTETKAKLEKLVDES